MSELINKSERVDEPNQTPTKWDTLADDSAFDSGEAQKLYRAELEQQTIDKLGQNRSAKKAFQKIILGAAMAAALIGGAASALSSAEQSGENHPIAIEGVIEAADAFVDKDSDDLVWFEEITDDTDVTVEYNQHFQDKGQSYENALPGNITQVEMDWWEGYGPMYRATDQNADGKWDTVQKYDVDTEELSTINLDDLEDVDAASLTMSGAEQLFD